MSSSPQVLLDVNTPNYSRRHHHKTNLHETPVHPYTSTSTSTSTSNSTSTSTYINNPTLQSKEETNAVSILNGTTAIQEAFEAGRRIANSTHINNERSQIHPTNTTLSSLSRQLHLVESQRDSLLVQLTNVLQDFETERDYKKKTLQNHNNETDFNEQAIIFSRISGEQIEKLRKDIRKLEREKIKKSSETQQILDVTISDHNTQLETLTNSLNTERKKSAKILLDNKSLRDQNSSLRIASEKIEANIAVKVENECGGLLRDMRESFLHTNLADKKKMDLSLAELKAGTISKEAHYLAMESMKKEFEAVKLTLRNFHESKSKVTKIESNLRIENAELMNDELIEHLQQQQEQHCEYQDLSADSLM